MDSNKLSKYLYDSNLTIHKNVLKIIEKEGNDNFLEEEDK